MSILHLDSVGKVRKILLFETVFHASASDCTKLRLVLAGWDVIAANVVHSLWTYFGYVVIVAVSLYLYLAYLDRYLC